MGRVEGSARPVVRAGLSCEVWVPVSERRCETRVTAQLVEIGRAELGKKHDSAIFSYPLRGHLIAQSVSVEG